MNSRIRNELHRFVGLLEHYADFVKQWDDPRTVALATNEIPSMLLPAVETFTPEWEGSTHFWTSNNPWGIFNLAYWFKNDYMKWEAGPMDRRYTKIEDLVKYRKGRCGEWAMLFGTMLVGLGVETRIVVDWTDHVWVEVQHPETYTYIPIDCTVEQPFFPRYYRYDSGKKLSYILAFEPGYVEDVTDSYVRVRDWPKVAKRRKLDPIPDYIIETHNYASL